jgi:hypothetical protein
MKALASSQTIAAVATYDAKICCTLWGMEFNGTSPTENYMALAQTLVSNNAAVIYTVPVGVQAFIHGISVVNTDSVKPCAFQLFRGGVTAAFAITPKFQLGVGEFCEYGDQGWEFFDSASRLRTAPHDYPVLRNLGFANVASENMSRELVDETAFSMTAGTLYMSAIALTAGMTLNSLSCITGVTPTTQHAFIGLYNRERTLLAQTADFLATFPSSGVATGALTAPFTVQVSDIYYIGVFMASIGGNGQLRGKSRALNGLTSTGLALCGTSNTGLTTALPDPANALTALTAVPWVAALA